jgi:hypothetical protein
MGLHKNRFPNENGPVPLMFSLPHTGFDMGNMAGVLQEAEVCYSYGAPESTPGFWWGPCCSYVLIKCCVCGTCMQKHE